MAAPEQSILLRLKSEGRDVPDVDLREAERGDRLSVSAVSLQESGRFQVLGELAAGGVGQILKGRDIDLGRDVALKVIHEKHLGSEQVLQRFIEEAQIGGQLQHPGIVPVYELGLQADKRPFFAMKLVKGQTLAAMLNDRASLADDRRRFLHVFEEICQTVGYAHARGVIHRDLKPANVMVGAFGEVQVLDWGFAKVLARGGIADERASRLKAPDVTQIATVRSLGEGSESVAGSIMGTFPYMPPEQALGQVDSLDERSDVFSLGAILCEILTGSPPYTGEGRDLVVQAAQCRLDDATKRLDACGAHATLVDLAKRCLSPVGKDRPRNASALAEVVHDHLAQAEERARTSRLAAAESRAEAERSNQEAKDQTRLRRLGLAFAGAVVLALAIGGGGYLAIQSGQRERAERAHTAVTTAMNEAQRLSGEKAWPQAHRAATQATELASAPEVDEATRARATSLLATVEEEVDEAAEIAAALAKDEALLAEIEEIRGWVFDERPGSKASDAAYDAAYGRYGIEVWSGDPAEIGARVRERGEAFAVQVAAALDGWAWMHDRRAGTEVKARARILRRIAAACDRDPRRSQLRAMVQEGDIEGLVAFAEDDEILDLPARSLLLLGRALRAGKEPDAAIALLESASRRHPDALWIHYELAWANKGVDRTPDALRHATAVLALEPESASAHNVLGAVLHDELRAFEEAERAFRTAIQLNPEMAIAHRNLGSALRSQKRVDGAVTAFREAIRLSPDGGTAYWYLSATLLDDGRENEALSVCRAWVERLPDSERAHRSLGDRLYQAGRYEEALASYEEALRLDPSTEGAHNGMGNTLTKLGRIDDAIVAYETAIDVDPDEVAAYANLGGLLREAGRLDRAVTVLREAIRLDPDYALSYDNLGSTLRELGKIDEAVEAHEEAIFLDPNRGSNRNNYGLALAANGLREEAIEQFRQALRLDPSLNDVRVNLAVQLLATGRIDEARETHLEALRQDPTSAVVQNAYGSFLRTVGRIDEAIERFAKAVQLDPEFASAHHNLGDTLRQVGRLQEALMHFRTAIRLRPDYARPHTGLGTVLGRLGQGEAAIAAHRKAIRLDPTNHIALSNYAATLATLGRFAEAVEVIEEALERSGGDAIDYNNLGTCLQKMGRLDKAVAAYREALQLDPSYVDAHNGLGYALYLDGQLDDAEASYRVALRLDPNHPRALGNLGRLLLEQGRAKEAAACYRQITRLHPDRYWPHVYLGRALRDQGRFEEAVEAFVAATGLDPEDPQAHLGLGGTLHLVSRPEEAASAYEEALQRTPDDPKALCDLGHVMLSLGRFEEAVDTLRKGHERGSRDPAWSYPSDEWLRDAEQKLALAERLPALLRGEDEPADASEKLEFAQLCLIRKHPDHAARLYRDALTESAAVSKTYHLVVAASAAVLCAAGTEGDLAELTAEERVAWRNLALEWLERYLDQERGPQEGRLMRGAMLTDPDLATVRDEASLEELSEEEQRRWRALWASVRAR